MRSLIVILIACLGLVSGEMKFIDLTHKFGESTRNINWPFLPQFNYSLFRVPVNGAIEVVLDSFETVEHFGTHVDVPKHFCPNGSSVHEVPLDKLAGPGVVLDFKSQAEKDIDYRVTLKDVKDWEEENGQIPEGAIVLFNFGWYRHWPNAEKVFGTKDLSNVSTFHMPGVGIEAARYLSGTRKVNALGVDSPTPELPEVQIHINFLCQHGLVILENVDNLDAMPATGSHVYIAPIKLENGGGAPVRLFAIVDGDRNQNREGEKLVDLSQLLGYSTPSWPNSPQYNFSLTSTTTINESSAMVFYQLQTSLHFKTHMDVPYHFCPDGKKLHEISLEKLSGPGVVIDLRAQAEKDDLYQATLQDVKDWEDKYGEVPEGAVVLFKFGWSKYWTDLEKFFGSKDLANMSTHRYPTVGIQAARYLSGSRKIHAIGVDSPTPDITDAPVHVNILCGHGLLILECLDNLDAVPASGSYIYIGAPKLENAAGVPVRVFASVTLNAAGNNNGNTNGAGEITSNMFCLYLILSMVMMFLLEEPHLCL